MATDVGAVTYTTFGSNGAGNDQFNNPLGMAFNHDKTEIFVADSNNNRVQVLSYDREKCELKFKETFINHLKHPSGVAVFYIKKEKKEKDIIIVADSDNDHICLLNTSIETTYPVFRPCSVALDACANIFAYDSSNCRIAIFTDSSTNYICSKGSGNGQLGGRGTLAFDNSGNLVVADTENNRVQVLKSSDGTYIRTITGIIDGDRGGQLNRPGGIAFTDDGKHIIIADSGNHRVRVLTYADGVIVNTFVGDTSNEFNKPYGVLVDDENGRIIVSDENHRIQVIHNALSKKLSKVDDKSTNTKLVNLQESIINEISSFIEHLKPHKNNNEYIKILNELMGAINKDRVVRAETDADALAKFKLSKKPRTKKAEPKPVSQLKTKDEVTTFIKEHETDAIFVVTGGSFNPPHNGHIGMFQKAYEALMKVETNKGKKVYGVMAPAPDWWIENKLCKEAIGKSEDCNETELTTKKSQAAINSKRIKVVDRVNLCKLSCDSYEWTDKGKFGAENMIVLNESAQGEQFTSAENTYYLCGSDYYKESKTTKFICVLRKGDVKTGTDLVKKDGSTIPIKATDIIVNGSDIDNDASSTMLRNMLTKINSIVVSGDELGDIPSNRDELLKLISIPVLRRLLELKYILTDAEKNKTILKLMGIDLDAHRDDDVENEDKPANYLSTGLRNGGSYCYLNSAFQFLFSATPLRTWIKSQSKSGDAENTIESNTIQLLKMMVESSDAGSKRTVDGKEYKDKIEKLIASMSKGDNRFKVGDQNDSHEILVPVLDALQEKKPDSVNSLKFREFVMQTKETAVSIPSPDNREKCVTGMLPITDDEIISIQIALNNYLRPTKGEVDEDGGKVTVNSQIQLQFEDSNQYFILCLNRTSFDGVKSVMNKKNITVDKNITVSQTYDVNGKSITEKKYNFKLRGAILKSGGAGGGHFKYISFENGPTNAPITYNDRNVYVSKPDELKGEYSIENNSYIFLYEKNS